MSEVRLNKDDVAFMVSRALFRRLKPYTASGRNASGGHVALVASCELAVRRMMEEPDFSNPARFLFRELRDHFPLSEQPWVRRIVEQHLEAARDLIAQIPAEEETRECAAFTRQGSPCRREARPGSHYCPSHRHLEPGRL